MPENCEKAQKIAKEPGKVRKTMQMISFSFMRSNISFFICLVVKEHIFKKEEKFKKNSVFW